MIYLEGQNSTPEMESAFGGYNHNISINANEFYDMKNGSCDLYPLAANRGKRGYLDNDQEILGICGKDNMVILTDFSVEKERLATTTTSAITRESLEEHGAYIYNGGQSMLSRFPFKNDDSITRVWKQFGQWSVYDSVNSYHPDLHMMDWLNRLLDEAEPAFPPDTDYLRISYLTYGGKTYPNIMHALPFAGHYYTGHLVVEVGEAVSDLTLDTKQFALPNEGIIADIIDKMEYKPTLVFKARANDTAYTVTGVSAELTDDGFVITTNSTDAQYLAGNDVYLQLGAFILNYEHEEEYGFQTAYPLSMPVTTVGVDFDSPESIPDLQALKVVVNDEEIIPANIDYTNNQMTINGVIPAITTGDTIYFIEPHGVNINSYDVTTQTYSNRTRICDIKAGRRQFIEMGAYVVILPEKYVVNTTKIAGGRFTDIKQMETTKEGSYDTRVVDASNETLLIKYSGPTAPENPSNGDIWIDTTQIDAPLMKRYSSELGYWTEFTPYLEIDVSNAEFGEGDAIRISGFTSSVCPAKGQKYYVIHTKKDGFITVQVPVRGLEWTQISQDTQGNTTYTAQASAMWLTLTRNLPVMDYVIESGNRLWGCRYGANIDGDTVNEIYASKLGDPCNWNYFANTSIDSYYVSLGSDGPFTGAVNYQTNPVFFKTDCVHRVTGYYPANYQVHNINGYGIQPGSADSVQVMNNIVYYLSPVGMMCYSGDVPVPICQPFGTELYHSGVAGTVGNKYYISMKDAEETPHLFVYDDAKAMWHREDNTEAKLFATYDNECYMVTADNHLIATGGIKGDLEDAVEWMLQSGDIGYTNPYHKRLLKILLRLQMELTAYADLYIQYDNDGTWRHCHSIRPTGRTGSVNLPIMPQRCDHFAIKLEGRGEIKMLSMTRFYTVGSDVT